VTRVPERATPPTHQTSTMATAPTSSFAAILRRSRFASFDPAIDQVYSTHGGHASRGDWGLKRPLSVRGRDPRVTVGAVDSPAQQTEWARGAQKARWIAMWDELHQAVRPTHQSAWGQQIGVAVDHWTVDADGARAGPGPAPIDPFPSGEALAARQEADAAENARRIAAGEPPLPPRTRTDERAPVHAAPLPGAMSARRFAKYERELRARRPAFLDYVAAQRAGSTAYDDAYGARENLARAFLRDTARAELFAPGRAGRVAPQPHPTGGLTYVCATPLQQQLTSRAVPGRITRRSGREGGRVGVAGMQVALPLSASAGRDGAAAADAPPPAGTFRLKSGIRLEKVPGVVGRAHTGLDSLQLRELEALNWDDGVGTANPHSPGSRAWVAWSATAPREPHTSMFYKAPPPPAAPRNRYDLNAPAQAGSVLRWLEGKNQSAEHKGFVKGLGDFLKSPPPSRK
jgi:hypothetical protein